jgi:hypothetical protein
VNADLAVHVLARVDVHHQRHGGHQQEHHRGQPVDEHPEFEDEPAAERRPVVGALDRFGHPGEERLPGDPDRQHERRDQGHDADLAALARQVLAEHGDQHRGRQRQDRTSQANSTQCFHLEPPTSA